MLWLLVSEGGRGETGWVRGFLQFPTGVGSGVGLTVASTTAELSRESGYVHEGTDSRGEGKAWQPLCWLWRPSSPATQNE